MLDFPGVKEHATAEERLRNVYKFKINGRHLFSIYIYRIFDMQFSLDT